MALWTCKGCGAVYNDDVWRSDKGICSICYAKEREKPDDIIELHVGSGHIIKETREHAEKLIKEFKEGGL